MSIKIKNDNGSWSTTGGARDASFAEISGNPSENPALNSALLGKQDEILTNIPGTGGQVLARTTDNTALEFINAGTGTGTVTDVIVDGTSVVTAGVAEIDLTNKVDKVIGKGLSTNDYTTSDKMKVATIPATGVGDGSITIRQDGVLIGAFSTNQATDTNINITSPAIDIIDVKVDGFSVVSAKVANINGKANVADLDAHKNNTLNPHSVTKGQIGLGNVENKTSATIRSEIVSSNVTSALGYTPLNQAKVGVANGVAQLGSDGIVPASQLPSYVDQIIEVPTYEDLPIPGLNNKIYVILSGVKANRIYRWGGTIYAEVTPSLALGETSSTAFAGDKGKIAFNHSQSTGGVHISAVERTRWNSKQDSLAIDQLAAVNSGITLARVNSYESHLVNISNPHGVTKTQIGLANVDNTKDVDKPVSNATRNALNEKLDKATVRADIVYGRINETDVLLPYNKWPSANSIVQRLDGGRVKAGTPTENTDVTPKLYVDNLTTLDNSTIERTTANIVQVKDKGITFAKLEDHPSDAGKIYAIHDDGTTILKTFKEMFLNMMYPVASRYIQLQGMPDPNTFGGTWVVDTDYNGRSIWCDSTQALGSTITQALPKPVLDCADGGEHNHTMQDAGEHTHTFTGIAAVTGIENQAHTHSRGDMEISGAFGMIGKEAGIINGQTVEGAYTYGAFAINAYRETVSQVSNGYWTDKDSHRTVIDFSASRLWTGNTSNESVNHNHNFTAVGTNADAGSHAHIIDNDGEHNHVVTVDTDAVYGTGTKVQPDAITCIVWKRTA